MEAKQKEEQTDAMMMSLPAPEDPPIIATIRLGVMAIALVIRFLNHFLIFKSRKPCKMSNLMLYQLTSQKDN